MAISRKNKVQYIINLEDRYPHLKRALQLLKSSMIHDRMIGYALLTTCFHLCPEEVQEHVREKWRKEIIKEGVKKDFSKYCEKKFGI